MRYALPMDTIKIQKHLDAIESFRGEYQAIQDKRTRNTVQMALMACVVCFLCGALAGASYWYLYGYPPETVTVEVLDTQEVEQVKVDTA
jgi:hypothetical protein